MKHQSGRHFLQIPGPTNVPDRVLRAIDNATVDHRGPEFQEMSQEVLLRLDGLKRFAAHRSLLEAVLTGSSIAAWARQRGISREYASRTIWKRVTEIVAQRLMGRPLT